MARRRRRRRRRGEEGGELLGEEIEEAANEVKAKEGKPYEDNWQRSQFHCPIYCVVRKEWRQRRALKQPCRLSPLVPTRCCRWSWFRASASVGSVTRRRKGRDGWWRTQRRIRRPAQWGERGRRRLAGSAASRDHIRCAHT